MTRRIVGLCGLVIASGLACGVQPPSSAQDDRAKAGEPAPSVEPAFIRTRESDDHGHLYLEVAGRTFVKDGGPVVHLVGAVHIGDKSYYEALQKFLDGQDVVLYEGVKPGAGDGELAGDEAGKVKVAKQRVRLVGTIVARYQSAHKALPESFDEALAGVHGTLARLGKAALNDPWGRALRLVRVPDGQGVRGFDVVSDGADGEPGGDGVNADIRLSDQKPLTRQEIAGAGDGLQARLARALGLEFQLTGIDYDRANWRDSDLSVDEVQKRLEDAGASGDALFSLLDGSSFASQFVGFMLGFIEHNPRLSLTMKVMMVEMLSNSDAVLAGAGAQNASMNAMMKVIVHDRNEAVLSDLRRLIADEKSVRSVALFYGAGHLPGLEDRLTHEMGYRFDRAEWFTAIDVPLDDQTRAQVKQFREMVRRMAEQPSMSPAKKAGVGAAPGAATTGEPGTK